MGRWKYAWKYSAQTLGNDTTDLIKSGTIRSAWLPSKCRDINTNSVIQTKARTYGANYWPICKWARQQPPKQIGGYDCDMPGIPPKRIISETAKIRNAKPDEVVPLSDSKHVENNLDVFILQEAVGENRRPVWLNSFGRDATWQQKGNGRVKVIWCFM